MFDEPLPRGSRLPESPRINSLLAGLMGSPPAPASSSAPALTTQQLIEPPQAPRSAVARPFSAFLKSISWSYVPQTSTLVVVTPGMPVREFFALVNWSGDTNQPAASLGSSIAPPSVENLMSQFSWD
jgi:hypothetical protein